MKFDFQLFADLDIAGIDEDILKELSDTEETVENSKEETKEEEQPEAKQAEPEPNGEADTDNKQVEDQAQDNEDEEVKEGQAIPYERFKSVNERRKTAESRIKELEEELKAAKAKPVELPKAQVQSPAQTNSNMYAYTAEQRKRIGEMAIERAKKKLNYSDEDVEALEYADDITEKLMYQNAVAEETRAISQEIETFKAKQQYEQNMYANNVKRFNDLSAKVTAYPDAQARIQFILNENFNKLDEEKKQILNDAYVRLQNKQGTNTDFRIVNSYINRANKLWEEAHGAAPQPSQQTTTKITQAQKLPKAPNINGGGGGDKVYTIAELTEIMNSKDGWDKLPEKIKEQILKGNMPL